MKTHILTLFRDDVTVTQHENGSLTIRRHHHTCHLPAITPGLLAAIQTLTTAGGTEDQLADLVLTNDGVTALPMWYFRHKQFEDLGFLQYSLLLNETKLATWTAQTPEFTFAMPTLDPTDKWMLSRFAYARRDPHHAGLIIESPLSRARVALHTAISGSLLIELSEPRTIQDLTTSIPALDEESATGLLRLLAAAQLLTRTNDDGTSEEDTAPTLPYWEFHDLLFHSRSRPGRHDTPAGSTFRFGKDTQPLPIIKPQMSTETIDLYQPDIGLLKKDDLPFTRVLEERQSIRSYDDTHPITLNQLGEFLYRTARLRHLMPSNERRLYDVSNRPYPNGGAMYELEIYVTVRHCTDLAPGLYQYDPQHHQLCKITDPTQATDQLLQGAFMPPADPNLPTLPHVLLTITARYPRVSWKYQSIAYALLLKNAGVLCQTMYLVATAMGLAPVALGSGNSETFAQASGIDFVEEVPVAEFALGNPFFNEK